MDKIILKYQLEEVYFQHIEMPKGAEILSVQVQRDIPCIWALVNPENDNEKRGFEIFGTGSLIQYDMGVERKYIGTIQRFGGNIIWHVFERVDGL